MILKEDEEWLAHYGVKGMKWGVRKSREERREARAKKHDAKASAASAAAGKLDPSTGKTNRQKKKIRQQRNELLSEKTTALKAAKDTRAGKLTDKQKKVLKGAAAGAAVVAAVGAYSVWQSGEGNRLALKGRAFLNGTDELWEKKPELAKRDMTFSDLKTSVVSKINPDYGGLGTKMNCRRATYAYEMRRRGHDVAATKTISAHGQTVLGNIAAQNPDMKPPKASGAFATGIKSVVQIVRKKQGADNTPLADAVLSERVLGKNPIQGTSFGVSSEDIFRVLSAQPDRSRGEITVQMGPMAAHSMAYEIIKGRPAVFDAQSGESWGSAVSMSQSALEDIGITAASFTRLDDLDLNENFLGRWLKNAD